MAHPLVTVAGLAHAAASARDSIGVGLDEYTSPDLMPPAGGIGSRRP
jgi:hypothetical protein